MSTPADILINNPNGTVEPPKLWEWRKNTCELLKIAPVFVINDVAKYFFDVFWDQKGVDDSNFPNVAPPYQVFWMEYRVPMSITGSDPPVTVPMVAGGRRVGLFWFAENLPGINVGWRISSNMFVEEEGRAIGPTYALQMETNHLGELTKWEGISFLSRKDDPPDGETQHAEFAMLLYHDPAKLALCFLHCRNVSIVEHSPKESHKRRHQKLYGRPPIVYKTLNITPMRRVIEHEGGSTCDLKQALHIMRGHFKRYEERPLFGKLKGMWWWDSQVRGSLQHGLVKKNYAVHPEEKDKPKT